MLARRILVSACAVALTLTFIGRAIAADAPTAETMGDFKTNVDKDRNLHVTAQAEVTAPADKVFEALSHPELVSKYDLNVQSAKVVSQNGDSKVVELTGQTVPIPNAPKSIKIKIVTDKAANTVKSDSVDSKFFEFHNVYKVAPGKDAKSSKVDYQSVSKTSAEAEKSMGFDIPESMRSQIALQNFMQQLHTVGEYIDHTNGAASAQAKQ